MKKHEIGRLDPGFLVHEIDVVRIMPKIDLQSFDFEDLHQKMLAHGSILFMDAAGALKRMGSKPPKSNMSLVHRLFDIGITINGEILDVMKDTGMINYYFDDNEIMYRIEVLNAS